MSKNKKTAMILGACAALLGVAVPAVQAQTSPTVTGYVNLVSAQPDAGVVAIRMIDEYPNENGEQAPLVLCPNASSDEGKLTALVPDLPQYRTLIDLMLKTRNGTIEVRQVRNACYVTRFTIGG